MLRMCEKQMSRVHILTNRITIDNERTVTLVSPGSGTMLRGAALTQIHFKGVALRNPVAVQSGKEMITGIVYDPGYHFTVSLDNVQVSDKQLPFLLRIFSTRNSSFTGNGDNNNPVRRPNG